MMLRRAALPLVALALAVPACSRRTRATNAPPPPPSSSPAVHAGATTSTRAAAATETEAAHERRAARRAAEPEGEDEREEIMEHIRDISPFPPTEAGLAHLFREVLEAGEHRDAARLEALVRPLAPSREPLALALTFEGARELGPYLLAQPGTSANELLAQAQQRWARATSVEVSSATAGEVAQGAPAATRGLDPGMRAIAAWLRPMVRWYRVTLRGPSPQDRVVIESLLYAGGRWMVVPAPWRMAPGSPARGTVDPGAAWTIGTRVELPPAPQPASPR